MAQINVYLHFNANCREAMEFYKKVFGGELKLMTVEESPMAAQMPKMKDMILHSVLKNDRIVIMASDWISPEKRVNGNTISVALMGSSKDELEKLFSNLSFNGKIRHALKEEFFGTYGDLTDQFGITWMLQYSKDPM